MTQTRVYLPMDTVMLRRLAERREIGPAPVLAHAVTEALERSLPGTDDEELEYAALCDAADAAGELVVLPTDKRVVAAADVESTSVTVPAGGPAEVTSLVEVSEPVPLRRIVSVHVEDEPGGGEDLLWYDVTELDEVIRSLQERP